MKPKILLFVLLPVLYLGACANLEQAGEALNLREPTAKIESVRLNALDFDGVNLAFDVRVDNPNPVGITLGGLDYDLKVMGSSFIKGNQQLGAKVAANGSSVIEAPLRLEFDQLVKTYRQLETKEEAEYLAELGVGIQVPVLGQIRVPVKHSGVFPIPKWPDVRVKGLDFSRLTMAGGEILLQLEVDNPNQFSLLLKKLEYGLKLNGSDVGGGLMSDSVTIDKDGKGVIKLPLSLNFLQLGMGLYTLLLQDKPLDYQLTGKLDAASSNKLIGDFTLPLDKAGSLGAER
jgi:LEA14-like dessication related protein